MSDPEYNRLLESVVVEANNLRRLIGRDDHWCIEDCHKCKTRDAFDLALNKLENYKSKRVEV
jgi:hypothetical protein